MRTLSLLYLLLLCAIVAIFAAAISQPTHAWAGFIVLCSWIAYAALGCRALSLLGRQRHVICGGLIFGLSYLGLVFLYYDSNTIALPTSLFLWDAYEVIHGEKAYVIPQTAPNFPWRDKFMEIGEFGMSWIAAWLGGLLTMFFTRPSDSDSADPS